MDEARGNAGQVARRWRGVFMRTDAATVTARMPTTTASETTGGTWRIRERSIFAPTSTRTAGDVGDLEDDEREEERSGKAAPLLFHDEAVAVQRARERKPTSDEGESSAIGGRLRRRRARGLDSREDEGRTERSPGPGLPQSSASRTCRHAHHAHGGSGRERSAA